VLDDLLDDLMPDLAAIAIEGAKGVGKSATCTERVATVVNLSNPQLRSAVAANWDYVTTVASPVLVDEWQLYPPVWDRVKIAVDDDPAGGRFLLAGSATAPLGARVHSGAGRIVSLRMRPLTMSERALVEPVVSLSALLGGSQVIPAGTSPVRFEQYVEEILRSGFPGIRSLPDRARDRQLDSYLLRIVEVELPENGVIVRRPDALRRWLAAYAAATATTSAYTTILDAATPGEPEKVARATADGYRAHLERIFVLDPIGAWTPGFRPLKAMGTAPKHHLVDPALAARLVGVGKAGLLAGEGRVAGSGLWLGALFESLVAQSVRSYADAADARTFHMRADGGRREVDLIVERADQSVLAIEVKLSPIVTDHDVRHLHWLGREIGDGLIDKIVITPGDIAYRRDDGVAVIPLALLGP
jgi:predicted AAA+ superfamily ATPase